AETVEAWTREATESQTLLSADRLIYAEKVIKDFSEALSDKTQKLVQDSRAAQDLAEERNRFARDSLRMLAVQAFQHDPARQAAILREAESADPTDVPGWLTSAVAILHTQPLTLAELPGHIDAVVCIDMSADGTRVVTGGVDNTVRVWS